VRAATAPAPPTVVSGRPSPSGEPGSAALDTRALFRRFRRTRDPRALELLVRRFLPLARSLARRYYCGGEPLEDLEQVASLGLVKAVQRYDERRGVSLSSYAVPTIIGELKRYYRDHVWAVHVPRGIQERALAVNRATRELSERTGRMPTVGELAERLQLDEQDVLDALEAYMGFDAVSLDAPANAGDEPEPQPRGETIGCVDNGYERADDRLTINAAVRTLAPRERRILRMRVIEDRTQADIAARILVSQMQVSRLLRRTLDRLQDSIAHEPTLAG
jgi:RNA polymerase sigma-B factor